VVAEVDGERKPQRQPRAHQPRRLRDISHLYLSSRSAPSAPVSATSRRSLRVGFVGSPGGRGQAEVCANMAVQLARLGQRTLVLDLEPHLPNVGFLLGLEPAAYMSHLLDAGMRLERALLGLRLLVAASARPESTFPEAHQREVEASDCVLVNLPQDPHRSDAWLSTLEKTLRFWRSTTMVKAAARSPMFGTWLETAHRSEPGEEILPSPASPHVLDALLLVHDGQPAEPLQDEITRLSRWLPASRIRLVGWGANRAPTGLQPWAWIQPHEGPSAGLQLLSSLFPEHPASRTYQGLVQSLLAGAVQRGGMHA
jgi:hypothetical protein